MAAALSEGGVQGRFKDALRELNFSRRCHALASLGRELKSSGLPPDRIEALVDALEGDPAAAATPAGGEGDGGPSAFADQARLIVAKAGGCVGYARRMLDHPSQTVRFAAVRRKGLLKPEDARAAFLSADSSRKLKKFLAGCPSLPCDWEVLDHAWQVFGERDKDKMWQFLMRVEDEELLKHWLRAGSEMGEWLDGEERVPGIPQLAQRFPRLVVSLVEASTLKWQWFWVKDILQTDPRLVLRSALLEGFRSGSGPKRGYNPTHGRQDFAQTLANWGWRRQPELMLEICEELTAAEGKGKGKGKGGRRGGACRGLVELAAHLMSVTSTRHYLTANQKITYLCRIWSLLPDELKSGSNDLALEFVRLLPWSLLPDELKSGSNDLALEFVRLLPKVKADREAELKNVIQAFWTIVDQAGRIRRRELLVGPEKSPALAPCLTTFLDTLPPEQAVDQFFRLLREYEAPEATYKYLQSRVCKSEDGRHDELMQNVFRRYLEKEGVSPVQTATMFQVLLEDAKSQDVIQTTFNSLLEHFGGLTEPRLFQAVVQRIGVLDKQCREQKPEGPCIPKATLPIPIEWVQLVTLPKDVAPHVDFLLLVLHSGLREEALLGAMVAKYDRCFFWEALSHVLVTAAEKDQGKLWKIKPKPDLSALANVDVACVSRVLAQSRPTLSKAQSQETFSKYFNNVGEAKKKVNAKDPVARGEGYLEVMTLAAKDQEASKAFEDLFPWLLQRFTAEQESVRLSLLSQLLSAPTLPEKMWNEKLPHLRKLWTLSSKTRESSSYVGIWQSVGKQLVKRALEEWTAGTGPTEACLFGMEVATSPLNLPAMLVAAATPAETAALRGEALASAARWVLQTAVPLSSDIGVPVSDFWGALGTMAALAHKRGGERTLWRRWPFVGEWWRALLAQGAKQKSAEFIFVGVVSKLADRQKDVYSHFDTKDQRPWWEPLECDEYGEAVGAILRQIESGEIPIKEGSSMIARRVEILVRKARMAPPSPSGKLDWIVWPRRRRARLEDANQAAQGRALPATTWVANEAWDIPKHHVYTPLPWSTFHCRDSVATLEIRTLSQLAAKGHRQVLWMVLQVSSYVAGPEISEVLEDAIATLDPRVEGMARCISRHYPYLNSALARDEDKQTSTDVLTPLLELWLLDDASRDERVGKLMERTDREYLVFFGTSFARHLSNARQEWLHRCLLKLSAPTDGKAEFFHYARRGPMLRQLAQLRCSSSGWRAMLKQPHASPQGVQMFLWHPQTQAEFARRALYSTDSSSLSLLPRPEYADAIAQVAHVLDRYPREQTAKENTEDLWGWEVIQSAGAYSSITVEIERRFLELPAAWVCDAVEDAQVEVLLSALGRADDATKSLKVLGKYAGKVKQAKEAVTKMMSQLSPPQARVLIKDVMLPKKAGVGLQVAGLKMIVDLHIPNPFDLYRMAWRKGYCQRDVAGNILAKVATSLEFSPESVSDFFTFFSFPDREDDQIYVAEFLLEQLTASPEWTMPFLPGVVAKLAMLPGVTKKAVAALQGTTTNATEVLKALTEVMQAAKLAARAGHSSNSGRDAQLIEDLKSIISASAVRGNLTALSAKLPLEESNSATLLVYVVEVLELWQETSESSLLDPLLGVWAKLLRSGHGDSWYGVLTDMEGRLLVAGNTRTLMAMVRVVAARVSQMGLAVAEHDRMLATVGRFFKHLLDDTLAVAQAAAVDVKHGDAKFERDRDDRITQGRELVLTHWAGLLARGCSETETDSIFVHCPAGRDMALAKALVDGAVECERRAALADSKTAALRTQRRPDEGWAHAGGIRVEDVKVGSIVSGVVTNSSGGFGVFFDFGCVRDGKLNVPQGDWKKYHVGDRVERMIVNKVDISSKTGTAFIELLLAPGADAEAIAAGHSSARAVAQRAIGWLAAPAELREARKATLTELWAATAALESDGSSFEACLALLGSPPPSPKDGVGLVDALLKKEPCKSLARAALTWLGRLCPADAVRLWPALLAPQVELTDVKALLALCAEGGHRFPKVSPVAARGLDDEVLAALATSELPEARLVVVQALQERQCKLEDPRVQLLKDLMSDGCLIVSVAARNSWRMIGGVTEKEETAEDDGGEEFEDDELLALVGVR